MKGTNKQERYVLLGNTIHFYRDKEPFEKSGHSILGALEYDKEEDKVKCHECGLWFEHVGAHSAMKHKLKAREYKIRHGLRFKSALVGERCRNNSILKQAKRWSEGDLKNDHKIASLRLKRMFTMKLIKNSPPVRSNHTPEYYNKSNSCILQLVKHTRILARDLGRTPYIKELKALGYNADMLRNRFGSMNEFMKLCKLNPVPRGQQKGQKGSRFSYGKKLLLKFLKGFYSGNGRQPYLSDCKRNRIPSVGTYVRAFGSWNQALKAADIPFVKKGWDGGRRAKKIKLRLGELVA